MLISSEFYRHNFISQVSSILPQVLFFTDDLFTVDVYLYIHFECLLIFKDQRKTMFINFHEKSGYFMRRLPWQIIPQIIVP